MPILPQLRGRIELIVAGIDPIRHVKEPSIYYLDSAQDFYLTIVKGSYVAAGTTAAVGELLAPLQSTVASIEELTSLAKECLTATKMRWPQMVGLHQRLGVITANQTHVVNI